MCDFLGVNKYSNNICNQSKLQNIIVCMVESGGQGPAAGVHLGVEKYK